MLSREREREMNSIEILNALNSNKFTKKLNPLVLASNELPKKKIPIAKRQCLVVNTDPSYRPGSHWIGIYFSQRKCIVFDSSGSGLSIFTNKNILNFLRKNKRSHMVYNDIQLQDILSDVCGELCILFCLFMACNYSFHHFLKKISMNWQTDWRAIDKLAISMYLKFFFIN